MVLPFVLGARDSIDARDVQGDGDAGPVAARQETLAAHSAADGHPGQPHRHVRERHRMQLAFDLALSACLGLHGLMEQRAVECRDAGGRVAQVAAVREGGVE
jgi:hypothetical protein